MRKKSINLIRAFITLIIMCVVMNVTITFNSNNGRWGAEIGRHVSAAPQLENRVYGNALIQSAYPKNPSNYAIDYGWVCNAGANVNTGSAMQLVTTTYGNMATAANGSAVLQPSYYDPLDNSTKYLWDITPWVGYEGETKRSGSISFIDVDGNVYLNYVDYVFTGMRTVDVYSVYYTTDEDGYPYGPALPGTYQITYTYPSCQAAASGRLVYNPNTFGLSAMSAGKAAFGEPQFFDENNIGYSVDGNTINRYDFRNDQSLSPLTIDTTTGKGSYYFVSDFKVMGVANGYIFFLINKFNSYSSPQYTVYYQKFPLSEESFKLLPNSDTNSTILAKESAGGEGYGQITYDSLANFAFGGDGSLAVSSVASDWLGYVTNADKYLPGNAINTGTFLPYGAPISLYSIYTFNVAGANNTVYAQQINKTAIQVQSSYYIPVSGVFEDGSQITTLPYNLGGYYGDTQKVSYLYTAPDGKIFIKRSDWKFCNDSGGNVYQSYPGDIGYYDSNSGAPANFVPYTGTLPFEGKLCSGGNTAGIVSYPTQAIGKLYRNNSPSIVVISPAAQNGTPSNLNTFIPAVEVSDPDGDTLTCRYFINSEASPRDTKTISNTATTQTVSFDALNIGTLNEGQNTFRFEVSDGKANPVTQSVTLTIDKTPPTLGQVSFTSTTDSITVSGAATDESGMDPAPYRYTVGSNVTQWIDQTSYTQSGLTPNTAYPVVFEARDVAGNIQTSPTSTVYTKAQAPTAAINNNKASSLDINVSDSNPASTRYQITTGGQYVTSTGTLSASPEWITISGKKVTVTGLTPGTAYTFQVKARNGAEEETTSATVSGTTALNPPTGINGTPTQTSMALTWTGITGATAYEIEVDGSTPPINIGTSTAYTHTGLGPNTQHTYRVRACNAGGWSEWSSAVILWTLPYPPVTPVDIRTTPARNSITLLWSVTAGAEKYEIEVDGNTSDIINNGSSTTYVHNGLNPDTPHTYRVRAWNKGGYSNWSAYINEVTLPVPPETPTHIQVMDVKRESITLSWDSMERAAGYEVHVDSINGQDGTIIDNGTETTFTHEGLVQDTPHTYRIRAKNRGGYSDWSEIIHETTLPNPPTIPVNVSANAGSTEIKITWDAVVYATSYDLEIDGVVMQSAAEFEYMHRGLNPGEQHSYRVKAKNRGGESDWSNELTISTLPEENLSLTNVVAMVTTTNITLYWDAAAPQAEYDIEVDGVAVNNGQNTTYSHTGLAPNTIHTYRVKTRKTTGESDWCAILTISTLPNPPDAPASISAYATYDRIDIGWESQTGATGYEVEVDGVVIQNNERTSYTHQDLQPGTQHTYRVRAKNLGGVTAWSPMLKVSTQTPAYAVSCTEGAIFSVPVIAANIQDFQQRSFTITYDPEKLEVIDLCKETPEKETSGGTIQDADLTIEYTPGSITIRVNKPMVPGTSWSGVIDTLVFTSKVEGQVNITYTVK